MKTISFEVVMNRFSNTLGLESDRAIAECLGISPAAYSNRKVRNSIPYEELIEYLCTHNIDIGAMLSPEPGPYEIKPSTPYQLLNEQNSYKNEEFVEIPRYNVCAAAGHGVINATEEYRQPLAFRRDWLTKRHLSPANLAIVEVKGDSMETKLRDGDLVMIDTSQIAIVSDKTYVLRMDGHLLVKNLQPLPHGLVQVSSFSTGWPAYQVDLSDESLDMAIIGRVVASMHEW